ncbi:hypothetical protein [Thermomonas sp.]|uniref:hypothetical protein n=1 Tax=Thermomonas sp. TaxID=1971895 RepID=UPI00391DF675
MSPQEELDAALVEYEQAEERVGLEYQNWHYLQMSYDSLMSSLQQMGLSREKAQEQFDTYMQAHAESFSHALEQRALSSSRLAALLKRYPQLVVSLTPRPKRRLGI